MNDGASSTALVIVNVGLFHNVLCASSTLNDGASSTALMIWSNGVGQESSTASVATGWRLQAAGQEGRASRDVGIARELEFHTQCALRSYRVREVGQPPCLLPQVFAEGAWH